MTQGPRFLDEPQPSSAPGGATANPAPSPPEPAVVGLRGWLSDAEGPQGAVRHGDVATLSVPSLERAPFTAGVIALFLLLVGLAVLEFVNFVADQFSRSSWLGLATSAALAPMAFVVGWSAIREWRSYVALAEIDALRRGLASQDISIARRHAEGWMQAIGVSADVRKVIINAPDAATLRDLLRAGPLAEVEKRTSAVGHSAAVQVLAATAVSPWPGLDGVLVIWRGARLVRQVAQLYGHRPGVIGTVALFQRVAIDAGAVAAVDIVVSSATEALLNSPMAGGLAGQAAGAAVAARRMLRLAFATAESCRPV